MVQGELSWSPDCRSDHQPPSLSQKKKSLISPALQVALPVVLLLRWLGWYQHERQADWEPCSRRQLLGAYRATLFASPRTHTLSLSLFL